MPRGEGLRPSPREPPPRPGRSHPPPSTVDPKIRETEKTSSRYNLNTQRVDPGHCINKFCSPFFCWPPVFQQNPTAYLTSPGNLTSMVKLPSFFFLADFAEVPAANFPGGGGRSPPIFKTAGGGEGSAPRLLDTPCFDGGSLPS